MSIESGLTALGHRTSGGSVHFQHQDGPAALSIMSELTSEAATKLEVFLRELITEDAPALRKLNERRLEEKRSAETQQEAARYRNYNSPAAIQAGYSR